MVNTLQQIQRRSQFAFYFQLFPTDKPCQVCQGKENTSIYLFMGTQGILCQVHLDNTIELLRQVLNNLAPLEG